MTILAQGTVTDRPWGMTLGALGMRGLTGQVTIVSDGKQYIVVFSEGVIVGAYSPLASDAAVRLALTSNLITSTQINDITRRMAAAPDRDEIDLLAELVRLAPEQAARLRRRVVAQRAARTFSPGHGDFVVEDTVRIPVVPGGELDVRTVIFLGAKTNLAEERLVNELAQLGVYFELKPEALGDLPQFGFTSDERPVLDMLVEGAYVDEIIAAHPAIGDRSVRAITYALASCGAFKIGAPPRVARALTPSSAPTLQTRPAMPRTATPSTMPVSRTLTPAAPATARTMTPAAPATARTMTPAAPLESRTVTGRNAPPGQPATPRTSTGNTIPVMSRTSTGMPNAGQGAGAPHPIANAGSGGIPGPVASSPSGAIPQPVTSSPSPSPSRGIPMTASPSQSGGIPQSVTQSPSPSGGIPTTAHPSPSGGIPTTAHPSPSGVHRDAFEATGRRRSPSVPQTGTENVARARTSSIQPATKPATGGTLPLGTKTPTLPPASRTTPGTSPPASRTTPGTSPPASRTPPGTSPPATRPAPGSSPPLPSAAIDPPTGRKQPLVRRARRDSSAGTEIEHLLESKIPLLDGGVDHFKLLGLAMDASQADIRSAYFTLARKLHPDRLAAIGVEDDQRHAQRLMAQVNLAFAILNDPVKRKEYQAVVQRGGEAVVKAEEAKADELAMKVLRAEEAFKQGEMALRREQLAKALEHFKMAVELQPKEAEYQALVAWTQFAMATDKTKVATDVRKALMRAADANDQSPTARFYLGRVERMLGREREALACFYDVLQIKPNHTEAASEVRILQQRLSKR